MPQEEKVTVSLPESLQGQFSDLRQRLFSLESACAITCAVSALLLGVLLNFFSDRIWDTPSVLRTLFFGAAWLAVILAGAWWLQRWVIRPRGMRAFAVLVQRKYERLGDRLLGIVELADEAKRPAYFSPELYRAAIDQVAAESAKYDFTQAANPAPVRRQLYWGGTVLVMLVLAALILPEATWNSFRRWLAPMSRIPRFTLVELASLPREQIVAHGEASPLVGEVKYRSFWKPARVKLQFAGGRELTTGARNGRFSVELPPLTADEAVRIRVGDTSHELKLLARHRPAVEQALAQIELPTYLGYPAQTETAQSGMLEVLEGSSLVLIGRMSRPLRAAWLQPGEKEPQPVTVSSNTFVSAKLGVDGLGEVSLRWQDNLGLTNTAAWKLAIQTKRDAAPVPQVEEMYRETAVLESEVLPISIRASDDYGLKALGLNWGLEAGPDATNTVSKRDYIQEIAARDTKYLEHTFNFSPAVLGVPPESTVEIRAFALDYMPGRERSESPVYRIHVVGNAQHAEMVRQNLESLLVQLEEVTRLEEKLGNETRELKELQKLDTPEATRKIAELEQNQQQNAAQLQEMAAEGMKNLREALRNPAFNEEVLSEWTRNLHQMQKISQGQMKDAAKSLKSAGQSQSPTGREQELAEAQSKEEETVKALQQMQQKVNQGLDELQALTLAQRLRGISGQQKKVETTLQGNIPDTIGLTPTELNPRYQRANTKLAEIQNASQEASVKLQGEISRFYERTQKPNYGEVTHEMAEVKIGDELERIKGLIQENIGMEAMQNLGLWSDRFESWAAKLEPKSDPNSGGGEGAGQGGQQDDTALKQLLGLLRMREKQVGIQERTRLLHEHAAEKVPYRDGAVLLAASQSKLGRDLSRQAVENPFALLEQNYNDAITAMSDVEGLLDRPQTDQVTRSAEDKSIAALTDLVNLVNEEAKKSGSSSSGKSQSEGGEDMAFLMQMMAPKPSEGMQAGQSPGMNMSGGTTDKASIAGGGGETGGKPGDERSVKKSSSVPQNYPTEFREALENYYKALEEGEGK